MSKEALFPKSDPPSPRDFRFQQIMERSAGQRSFQFLWPEFQSAPGTRFDTYWKEIETKILKQAKEKILSLEKEAYEKGFAQGEKDGRELGGKKIEVVLQQLKNLLTQMERERTLLVQNYAREMIHLAFAVAQKILQRETEIKESDIAVTLKRAIERVVDRRKIIVHLNPADYQYLKAHPELVPLALEGSPGLRMIEDSAIQRGGCFIETSFGDVDATIEGQLGLMADQIWKIFEETGLSPSPPSQ